MNDFDTEASYEEVKKMFDNYNSIAKWNFLEPEVAHSYYLQSQTISNIFKRKTEGVKLLEAGPGAGYTTSVLRFAGFDVKTLDGQEANNPDILSDIRTFKSEEHENEFDLIACFQMLEHIKYEDALDVLKKFREASNKYVFISLPYHNKTFKVHIDLPHLKLKKSKFFNKLRNKWNKGIHRNKVINYKNAPNRKYSDVIMKDFPYAMHYWEIGRGDLTLEKLKKDFEKIGYKLKWYFPNEKYHYHYFFVLEVNK